MIRPTLAAAALSLCCTGSATPIDKSNQRRSAHDAAARLPEAGNAMTTSSSCDATFDALLRKELASLPVMPADCALAALAARIELDGADRRGVLGRPARAATYRGARAGGYRDTVEVWHRDGVVEKLVFELPQLADVPALLATLGEPDARLDYYPTTVPRLRERGAWVYAGRGLTLFMSGDGGNVVRFEVYPPTTAAAYERELFHTEPPRERP